MIPTTPERRCRPAPARFSAFGWRSSACPSPVVACRRRGFTLIELMVVIGILGILLAIAVPPWAGYRARMNANAVAQGLRAELVRLQARAISQETDCYVDILTGSYSAYEIPQGQADRLVKQVNVSDQGVQLAPDGERIAFDPRGWVDTGETTITSSASGAYTVYPISVEAPGLVTLQVEVHPNGKVRIR